MSDLSGRVLGIHLLFAICWIHSGDAIFQLTSFIRFTVHEQHSCNRHVVARFFSFLFKALNVQDETN